MYLKVINFLKIDVLVRYMCTRRFCSQLTENTVHAHYMYQSIEAAWDYNRFHS